MTENVALAAIKWRLFEEVYEDDDERKNSHSALIRELVRIKTWSELMVFFEEFRQENFSKVIMTILWSFEEPNDGSFDGKNWDHYNPR